MLDINWRINEELISKLDDKNRDKLIAFLKELAKDKNIKNDNISEILKNVSINVLNCLYCCKVGITLIPSGDNLVKDIFCPCCSETSVNNKIEHSLSNAETLITGSDFILGKEGMPEEEYWNRTIFEQSIVIIATGVEIFLRNVYAIMLNMRYIRSNKTLFQRFYNDGKNDFVNIGKAKKKFRDDLNIKIDDILGNNYNKLKLLMLKRNAIVHNSGFVDNPFKSQSGIECELKEQIPLDKNEIIDYIEIIKKFVIDINEKIKDEILEHTVQEINKNLPYIPI